MRRLSMVAGMAAAFVLTFAFRWLALSDFDNDHFDHVARGYQMLLGDWPVRDFVDEGRPLTYIVSAVARSFIDSPFLAEALIFIPACAVAAALSYRLALLLSGSALVAAFVVFLQVALYPRPYSYPKLLLYAVAIAAGWWAIRRLTMWRITALAGVTVVAYLFRHDHGVYVGAGYFVLLAAHLWPQGWRGGRPLAAYCAFTLLLLAPHLLYVQATEGLGAYLAHMGQYSVEEARKDRFQPPLFTLDREQPLWGRPAPLRVSIRWVPGLDEGTRQQLESQHGLVPVERDGTTVRYEVTRIDVAAMQRLRSDPRVEDTHAFEMLDWRNRWRDEVTARLRPGPGLLLDENSVVLLFWVAWLLPLAGVVALRSARVDARRAHPDARRAPLSGAHPDARRAPLYGAPDLEVAMVAMLVTLAICTAAGFIRDPLPVRLPDVAVTHSVLAAWLLGAIWRHSGRRVPRLLVRAAIVALSIAVACAVFRMANTGFLLGRTRVAEGPAAVIERWDQIGRELRSDLGGPIRTGPSQALVPFFRYVRACTAPDDRLLFVGYAPEVYVLAERGFAGGHIIYTSRFESSAEGQALIVSRLNRESVPFVIIPSGLMEHFREVYPDVARWVQDRYTPMASVEMEDGQTLEILIDPSRPPTGVHAPSSWPCLI